MADLPLQDLGQILFMPVCGWARVAAFLNWRELTDSAVPSESTNYIIVPQLWINIIYHADVLKLHWVQTTLVFAYIPADLSFKGICHLWGAMECFWETMICCFILQRRVEWIFCPRPLSFLNRLARWCGRGRGEASVWHQTFKWRCIWRVVESWPLGP